MILNFKVFVTIIALIGLSLAQDMPEAPSAGDLGIKQPKAPTLNSMMKGPKHSVAWHLNKNMTLFKYEIIRNITDTKLELTEINDELINARRGIYSNKNFLNISDSQTI